MTQAGMLPNDQIAARFQEVARLLNEQGANPYRVMAWQRAAIGIRRLREPVTQLYAREGLDGLRELPGIGERIATALRSLIVTGRLPMLERLRGELDPIAILTSVPGIGDVQAKRLHQDLGIDSLEDLEAAAHDGRLATIAGFGPKRIAGISDCLASRLGRVRTPAAATPEEVPVAELLDIDCEYREGAAGKTLRRIAPRRFNPQGEAWLPVLHTERGDRHYTALFSNTARAHEAGKTRDWVILYWDGASGERQSTVITARQGPLQGRRIVRGRENECAEYYGSIQPDRGIPAHAG
ncbi:MAG TPA: helix-hairpin-helix domain-containing protein [Bryobacteraceae bacterium]|nr:helix-hairpin-helix domain-containing protein [Bryobacteraceae bacterium]